MSKTFKNQSGAYAAMNRLAVVIQNGSLDDISGQIRITRNEECFVGKVQIFSMLNKLQEFINHGTVPYKVFAKGNSKLPFISFSVLPGVTCPGAGDCLDFCYSYRAWRFAHAFGRMAQNTMMMRFSPDMIAHTLKGHVDTLGAFDLRLYVDGDFSSISDVAFWMDTLRSMPTISAYGYSKSFDELIGYQDRGGIWPDNYKLNISSGHRHTPDMVTRIAALTITRGEFRAVSIGRKVSGNEHGTRETNAAVRQAAGAKVFVCPGKCGTCTPTGHACGTDRFKGIIIAIAMH